MSRRPYEDLMGILDRMPDEHVREARDFAEFLALRPSPREGTTRSLADLCGSLSADVCDRMERAIEEASERIEPDLPPGSDGS